MLAESYLRSGKVRDLYSLPGGRLVLVVDHLSPGQLCVGDEASLVRGERVLGEEGAITGSARRRGRDGHSIYQGADTPRSPG